MWQQHDTSEKSMRPRANKNTKNNGRGVKASEKEVSEINFKVTACARRGVARAELCVLTVCWRRSHYFSAKSAAKRVLSTVQLVSRIMTDRRLWCWTPVSPL